MAAASEAVLLGQHRHYMRPWRPLEKLSISTAAGGWNPIPHDDLPSFVVDESGLDEAPLSLFSIPLRFSRRFAELPTSDPQAEGDRAGVDESMQADILREMTAFLASIGARLSESIAYRMQAVAQNQDGVLGDLSKERVESVLRRHGNALSSSERHRDTVINLGPGAVRIRFPRKLFNDPVGVPGSPAVEDPQSIERVGIVLDGGEGLFVDPILSYDLDTMNSTTYNILLIATSL
jgi:hypothetical protein